MNRKQLEVVREGRTSLYCNCLNCNHSLLRSDFDLDDRGAWAYNCLCKLDDNIDKDKVYQSTHCCKSWKKKRGETI